MIKTLMLTLLLLTQVWAEGVTQSIRFRPGADSATVQGSVLRGDRDTYTLDAAAGQRMWLSIGSEENNATFDLYNTSGELCEQDCRSMNCRLPESGVYKVVVGPTRGNASYRLKVTIR